MQPAVVHSRGRVLKRPIGSLKIWLKATIEALKSNNSMRGGVIELNKMTAT